MGRPRKNQEPQKSLAVVPGPTPDRLLNIEEAAQWLGVGRTTVFTLMRDEELPVIRISGRMIRFDKNSLYQWTLKRQTTYCFIA